MRRIELKSVIWKEGDYYVSQCLNVEVSSFGGTKKQALINLQEALELYFADTKKPKFTHIERPRVTTLRLQHA